MNAPSIGWSQSESFADTAIVALCIFSVVNPLLAQTVSFFFPYSIAGLNIMQWFQGLCFVAILVTLPRLSKGCSGFSHSFARLLWAYTISFGLVHLRLLAADRVPASMVMTERMVYFKVIFALLLWYYASCVVRSQECARALLRSVLFGAIISAAWILICYFFGIGSVNYASVGVKATAGSEGVSGKAMAGFLLPAVAGAIFIAVRDGSSRWAMGAALMAVAVFVTFDRSAQVAFMAGLLWMAIWWLVFAGPKRCSKTVLLFLCIILVLGGVYYAHHGSDELVARWTHDFDRGEVGSGRGTFYMTACNWFWNDSSIMDFFFGMGYGNIYDLMHSRSGVYRHTHSDLFDMLLIGGVVGLVLYFLLFFTIASLGKGLPRASTELAVLGALLTSFGVMSLLTGLMSFPHTMYAFGAQCICIRVLATQEDGELEPSFLACRRGLAYADFGSGEWQRYNGPHVLNFRQRKMLW